MTARTLRWLRIVLMLAAAVRADVTLTVDPATVMNRIEEGIYGHFLEHIYHSCHGGLWGEVVWNRSFEEPLESEWIVEGDTVRQPSLAPDQRLIFGDSSWRDMELSFEAQKLGGREGFLAIVRYAGPDRFYWVNLGGWGNVRHQFEKCAPPGRRQVPVGGAAPGGIETGRWYRVRVRAEGARLRAWLDDDLILEWNDPEPIEAGRVGLGTWQTEAEFRNVKVTTSAGATLWEGVPPVPVFSARHWEAYGSPGRVSTASGDAANGRRCVRVRGEDAEVVGGLRQSNLCARAGDVLRGSLWVSGRLSKGLRVRVRDAAGPVAETVLPAADSAGWTELPVELRPLRDARDAVFEIEVMGPADARLDQVVLMPDSARATGGFRPDLLAALAALRPSLLRWPGGAYAEHYRWRHGVGPQVRRRPNAVPMWDDLDVNALGTDEFMALCRRLNAEPVLVINTGRHDRQSPREQYLREALDWVEYCNGSADSPMGRERAQNGHAEPYGVRYWEIDNEAWIINDVETYIAIVREFAPALRRACPDAFLIACGGSGLSVERHGRWDPRLIEACAELVDAISVHHYEDPNQFATGPARADRWFRELAELIRRSRNPNLKIFVSEWNAQSTDWRTGLYAGGLLNVMERWGDVVTMASPALLMRHASARAWDNAFINFDACSWWPAPNYVVMRLWRESAGTVRLALSGAEPPLDAVAVRTHAGALAVRMVNTGERDLVVVVRLATGAVTNAAVSVIAPGDLRARNTAGCPAAISPCEGQLVVERGAARLRLPAHSAAVLSLRGG